MRKSNRKHWSLYLALLGVTACADEPSRGDVLAWESFSYEIAVDAGGVFVLAGATDQEKRVVRIAPGERTWIPAGGTTAFGLAATANKVYWVTSDGATAKLWAASPSLSDGAELVVADLPVDAEFVARDDDLYVLAGAQLLHVVLGREPSVIAALGDQLAYDMAVDDQFVTWHGSRADRLAEPLETDDSIETDHAIYRIARAGGAVDRVATIRDWIGEHGYRWDKQVAVGAGGQVFYGGMDALYQVDAGGVQVAQPTGSDCSQLNDVAGDPDSGVLSWREYCGWPTTVVAWSPGQGRRVLSSADTWLHDIAVYDGGVYWIRETASWDGSRVRYRASIEQFVPAD